MSDNSAFISYRRSTGYPWARLIWDELQERSVNVFLDLETMRQAGRFDRRILNQIAARPYFLVVLTEGTLDRCASLGDWVRREIEYAIEVDRIVVPLFIAPFEPSRFPSGLPAEMAEVLSNSNGVTFYSQFVREAFDQLVALLEPVDRSTVDLTDDDAEFERNVVGLIRAEPQPSPLVPPPTSVPPPSGEESDVGDPPEDPLPDAPPVGPPPGSSPPDSRPGTGQRDPRPRWLLPAAAAAAVVVLGVVGLLVAGGGGGGSDAGATSVASKAPDGDHDGGTVVDAGESHSISTTDGNAFIAVDSPLESETGGHRLVMTPGGRLELRTGDEVVWTPTYFEPPVPGAVAILQESDGNLVVYPVPEPTADDRALWAVGEQPGTGVELRVFDEDGWGVVAVFRNGREVWRRGGAPSESRSGSTPVSEPDADTTVPTDSTRATDEPAPTTTEPPFATDSDLDGRSFVASSVEGRTLVDGTDLTMSFDGDRLSYNGGCNTTELRYELDAGVLGLIGPFLTSLIACDVAVSEQDRWFSDLLGADPTLTIVDGALVVSDGDVTITFR